MRAINLLSFLPWVLVPTCLLKCEHLTTCNRISELTDVTFLPRNRNFQFLFNQVLNRSGHGHDAGGCQWSWTRPRGHGAHSLLGGVSVPVWILHEFCCCTLSDLIQYFPHSLSPFQPLWLLCSSLNTNIHVLSRTFAWVSGVDLKHSPHIST